MKVDATSEPPNEAKSPLPRWPDPPSRGIAAGCVGFSSAPNHRVFGRHIHIAVSVPPIKAVSSACKSCRRNNRFGMASPRGMPLNRKPCQYPLPPFWLSMWKLELLATVHLELEALFFSDWKAFWCSQQLVRARRMWHWSKKAWFFIALLGISYSTEVLARLAGSKTGVSR